MTFLRAALASAALTCCLITASVLSGCAVAQPVPQRHAVTTHYHRTNAPIVLRTPRGNFTFHLMASEAGFALDQVGGDRSRPYTVGLVDPAGFTYASQDGPVPPPFRYTIDEPSPWTSLDLTPDGRGLLIYASGLSATSSAPGPINISVANEKLAPGALAGLREGDVVWLSLGADAKDGSAPRPVTSTPAPAPASDWWRRQ